MHVTGRFLDARTISSAVLPYRPERSMPGDHHVDLVCPKLDRGANVGELELDRKLPRRETGGDRRDLDAAAAELLPGDGDEFG